MKQSIATVLLGSSLVSGLPFPARENVKMSEMGQLSRTMKLNEWNSNVASGKWPRLELSSALKAAATCNNTDTEAGIIEINGEAFPCSNVDFLSFIALEDLMIDINGGSTMSSDIWGWEDPVTRQEITLHCMDNGMWYIDSTDPENPIKMAFTSNPASKYAWADVKVFNDTAYVVKDRSSSTTFDQTYGIQVIDLNRLREIDSADYPVELEPDFVYAGHGYSHNLAVDTESGILYSVGTGTCSGGLHMLDLKPDPLNPTFVGCVASDGYTHDVQCVVYDGPDSRFTGSEICFAFNEDTLTIWDVTDKESPLRLSRTGYGNARYTHQGWLTDDMKYVLLNDELDEDGGVVATTTTYIVDVSDLRTPEFVSTFVHDDVSIDHNLYVWGAVHKKGWGGSPAYDTNTSLYPEISTRFAYLSNYIAGLRVLDLQGFPSATQAGFFDCAPDLEGNIFEGTWSNYMHPSGTIAVSSIDRGLFFLNFRSMYEELVQTDAPTIVPTTPTVTDSPTVLPTASPTVCIDQAVTGLVWTATGLPATCDELADFCTDPRVLAPCPVTCGACIPDPTPAPTKIPTSFPTLSPVADPTASPTTTAPTATSGGSDSEDDAELDSTDFLTGIVIVLGLICAILVAILVSKGEETAEPVEVEEKPAEKVDIQISTRRH